MLFFAALVPSCAPFACICGTSRCKYSEKCRQSSHQIPQLQNYMHQTTNSATEYWLGSSIDPHQQSSPPSTGYCLPTPPIPASQDSGYSDFPAFPSDLFQPGEIFQLDQPLRPDFPINSQDIARSPSSLLDLGSGTIKYEEKSTPEQNYWNQILSDDSSNSQLSLPQNQNERLQHMQYPSYAHDDRLSSATAETRRPLDCYASAYQKAPIAQCSGTLIGEAAAHPSQSPNLAEVIPHATYNGYDHYQQIMNEPAMPQSPVEQAHFPVTIPHQQIYNDNTAHLQTSPEPFFYSETERCQYTCEINDSRITQMTQNPSASYNDVPDLELPQFVDYTLVGMLCSSADENEANGMINCNQSQAYVPHHHHHHHNNNHHH